MSSDDTPREPWQRRPDETNKSWLAFKLYRDAGPGRSTARAYHMYREAAGTISGDDPALEQAAGYFKDWSRENDWVKRAQAYDAEQMARREREHQAVLERGRDKIRERYVRLIELQLDTAEEQLLMGKLGQNVNMALKDLFDRLGGLPTQRVELDHELGGSTDGTPVEVRHTFLDEEKAAEVAGILKTLGAFDHDEEPTE